MVTRQMSAHGLRRMGFGGSVPEIDAFSAKREAAFVTSALTTWGQTPTRPAFLSDPTKATWDKISAMIDWWFDRMADSSFTDQTKPCPIVERMTMFWHNHFATSADKVFDATYLYDQNALFRANALGNFRTLCKKMAVQPAMLVYLDNESNTKAAPNQNFARELLELFTLGVGNYTEADVITCAAAWTGHNMEWLQDPVTKNWYATGYKFFPTQHDTTSRTFLGRTQVWDGPQIIDYLLDTPKYNIIVAKFIAKKMWTWLAYANPAQAIVDSLAATFVKAKFEIKPLLSAMFNRAEFWSAPALNGAVRSPIEYMVAVAKITGMRSAQVHPQWFSDGMGQQLFYPPNVSGWRPNEAWVNTSSMTRRADFAQWCGWALYGNGAPFNANFLKDLVNEDPDPTKRAPAAAMVGQVLDRFAVISPSTETTKRLTDWVIANRHRWTDAEPWNYWGERVHLIQQIMLCPDFQMN